MKVIGIVGIKGGCGKTVTAVHLAHEAAIKRRVALLDLDPTHQSLNWIKAAGIVVDAVALDLKKTDLEGYVTQIRDGGEHDLVIIDTAANDFNAALETAMVSDFVVLPVGVGTGDIGMLDSTARQIRRARQVRAADGKPPLEIRVLINRAGFAPKVTAETVADVEVYGLLMFTQQVPLRGDYQKSTANKIRPTQHHYANVLKEIDHALA